MRVWFFCPNPHWIIILRTSTRSQEIFCFTKTYFMLEMLYEIDNLKKEVLYKYEQHKTKISRDVKQGVGA